jgi:iron complex outermembrane recepter protein
VNRQRLTRGARPPPMQQAVDPRRVAVGLSAVAVLSMMTIGGVGAVAGEQPPPKSQTTSEFSPATEQRSSAEQLETVVVTGSLIPQSTSETATPVTVISAEDIQARGFTSVADALQQSSFATGSVQGPESGGFTHGAQTLSFFGLAPGYVKYLIDGRPMSDYPILYNGTDMITNIGGIPTVLVDHVDVLPGGQSSLYGSDAIAGLVNIVLKKQLDGPILDLRYGFYHEGGGVDKRIALADSFRIGSGTLLIGAQYEKTNPIWGYQRPLTASYYPYGTSPQTAARDWLVYGNSPTTGQKTYYFQDPNNCSRVVGQFDGSVGRYTRPGIGDYCGTVRSGYYNIGNDVESLQTYLHAASEVSEHSQLYGDVLLNRDVQEIGDGAGVWGTNSDYYDPNIGNLVSLQHFFSPEEAGGLSSILDRVTTNSYRVTLGVQGGIGGSSWSYDIGATRIEQKVLERLHVQFTSALEEFYASILGPNLGPDPIYGVFPTYEPNYTRFYTPLTATEYASFSGYADRHSQTLEDLFRLQVTSRSLFALPGGNAGIAVVAEGGDEGWTYAPDESYLDGAVYGRGDVNGTGHRTHYAATTELRLPLLNWITVSGSGRYDDYRVSGENVDRFTYNLNLEMRPLESLLLRGRYGTAFKAPTLADQFQGVGGGFGYVTDYYQCTLHGFAGGNLGNCPYAGEQIQITTSGNLKLQPTTADVWDAGVVWTPISGLSISADYIHWEIINEVTEQSSDQLLTMEAQCRLGNYDINSPTCLAALSQVTRDASGMLVSIYTPKINTAQENLNVVTASLHDLLDLGHGGRLLLEVSWSDLLNHTYQQYPGDQIIDLLRNPIYSTDFKSKVNGSVTWSLADWSSTFYVNHLGQTPNNLATIYGYGTPGAGALSTLTLCNLSVRYQWHSSLLLSAVITNLFNTMPPPDHSYDGTTSQPYNSLNYSVYGRSYLLEATYGFGT